MTRLAVAWLLLLGLAATASGQTFGIYADSAGVECRLDAPYPGGTVTAYLVAGFTTPVEVSGVSFRIVGIPTGWLARVMPTPGISMLGDALQDGAVLLLSCTTLVFPRVIATLELTPTTEVTNASLVLSPNATVAPMCSWEAPCPEPCPFFCECGAFGGPCYCPTTSLLTLNGPCTTAIETVPWGTAKRVYR